jgi:ATP-dependent DNA helicase RecQ
MEQNIEAAVKFAIQALGYERLREKQAEVAKSFVEGHDVFGVLPTGYGKSLCYACLPTFLAHT